MTLKNLINKWEKGSKEIVQYKEHCIKIPLHDTAKINALTEMYPAFSTEMIIADLLSAALEELEATLPYVKGSKIIAEDELGDPIHEDVGQSPRFQKLTKKYLQLLEDASKNSLAGTLKNK